MGNKTGKFDVTKTENEVKENEAAVNAEHKDVIKEDVKAECTAETELKENGEAAEPKEVDANSPEEKKAVEEEKTAEKTDAPETKKKGGVLGWLKKLSFRKDKEAKTKTTAKNEENHDIEEKAKEELEPKVEEEKPAEVVVETEKVEEPKVVENTTTNVEEAKSDEEAKVSE